MAAVSSASAQEVDVTELTITEIQEALAAGTYTAEQLTQAFIDRINTYEPYYNAFTFMNDDALEEARAVDAARAAGEPLGPLAGVPIVVKEAIDMVGYPSTSGWDALYSGTGGIDLFPAADAPVVARLRAAGAIILGKTNIPRFSSAGDANNSWAGPTYNALDRTLSPGGSSAGTATSVSGNLAIAGLGEETRGSLQIPAALQSLVTVKPSFGLVPNAGVTPLGGSTTDVIGPITRTVMDAAIMLDVLAGPTVADLKTVLAVGHIPEGGYTSLLSEEALQGARIGLFSAGFDASELTPETQALFAAAVEELTGEGAVAVPDVFVNSGIADLGASPSGLETGTYDYDIYLRGMTPESPAHSLAELVAALPPEATAEGAPGNRFTRDASMPDITEFMELRERYLAAFQAVMDEYDLDGFVFPVFANGAPPIGSRQQTITVAEINISGLPGVVVPAGEYADGEPFALIFIGPMWSEAQLLAYAYDYEQATHHRIVPVLEETPPPPIPEPAPAPAPAATPAPAAPPAP